jgi:xylulokinase
VSTFLGIDVGTSGVKAILIDEAGKPIGEASAAAVEPVRPHPGWSEQNPADWWSATLSSIDKLKAAHPAELAAVKGIGLSGHMHGATLLGKDHEVLRPAILWNDGRSHEECGEMERALSTLREIAGNIAMPGFTAPKIAWVRKHEPAIYDKIALVLLPKAYVRLLLTGEAIEDMSDASGTLWLDVGRRDWSDDLLALTGFTRANMPKLAEGTDPAGHLKDDLKARWGMTGTVVVAGSAGDNAAAACGIGAIRPGEGFVSLGTSGVLFVSNDRFRPNTEGAVHAFCHAIPNTWHQMGVILSATDSLNWLSHLTGQKQAELSGKAEAQFKGPGEEIFLPYLSGERTPYNNANARGSFVGLSHLSGPERLAQAIMEGVAFAFRDSQRVLNDAGTKIDRLLAVGGGSKSNLWLKMIATNLGMELSLPEDGDFGGALGAARLGLCAATGASPQDVITMPGIKSTVAPDASLRQAYDDQYARYRALYPAIEEARK